MKGRPAFWDQYRIIQALCEFEMRNGRRPSFNDSKALYGQLPGRSAINRVYGSWSNAMVAAFGWTYDRGGAHLAKDEDTELVLVELEKGRTLTDLGRERGITGQALGRRVRKYREMREKLATIRGESPTPSPRETNQTRKRLPTSNDRTHDVSSEVT